MARNTWKYCWVGLLLFCACERLPIYQKNIVLDNCHWPVDTVLEFSFRVKNIAPAYDILLVVKNTQDYPYQNLYATHYLEDETKHLLHQTLNNCPLFDFKTGKPLGSGLGKSKKHELVIVEDHQFSHTGLYIIKLEHFMRTDTLPGLQAIGIKVVPSQKHPK